MRINSKSSIICAGGANMISVQSFIEKYNNKALDFDKQFGAQCVDLFNFYNNDVVGGQFIGTPATMGARDLYEVDSAARAKSYKKLAPDEKLQIGDVLVYGPPLGRIVENGVQKFYGHVAIYIGNNQVIQQNARIAQKTTIDPVSKSGMLGILRPLRFIGENSPQNTSPAPQNKNKHTIKSGDTFWGLEQSNGWTHGILQQLNPGVDAKKLQIGAQIAIPEGNAAAQSPAETYYIIKSGDTFWELENAWQIEHGTLQRLNPNADARQLQVGQRIRRS